MQASSRVASTARHDTGANPPEPEYWTIAHEELLVRLDSSPQGLSGQQARARLRSGGANTLDTATRIGALRLFARQFTNPLVLILVFAAVVSMFLRDWTDAFIVGAILLAGGCLSFAQEHRASRAIERLRARLAHRVRVLRDGEERVIDATQVVPGDLILLRAGSLVPADAVVLEAKDLFVSQSVLTGESFPVEKRPGIARRDAPLAERTQCLFMGTSVRSGTARALVVRTGQATAYSAIARTLTLRPPETAFERGVRQYSALLSRIMIALVVIVFTVNILSDKPPIDSLLFAIALAVGISPELLPAIIAITLSKGARAMAAEGVIVRRLSAIENLGGMDVLCTDKTGTLTEGAVRLHGALDAGGNAHARVARLAFLNARLQTGIPNPLDAAIVQAAARADEEVRKLDEIPYDFERRRLSIVVPRRAVDSSAVPDDALLIAKGALTAVLEICQRVRDGNDSAPLDDASRAALEARFRQCSAQGYRVLGVATRELPLLPAYGREQERDLVFEGFLLFLDPPRQDAAATVRSLAGRGVRLKILTGDNRHVASHLAEVVGLTAKDLLTGEELNRLRDEALWHRVEHTDLFVELDPMQKERVIRALRKRGHVVGYLGDGINDAPALHEADIGISVDGAAEVAREAADLVLLRHSLSVLLKGIEQGRTTFANSIKYVLITTSANFGNMVSMAALSPFLPFLPLLATQILLNNFLSDIPALALANDRVDADWIERPRKWDIAELRRFMVVFGLLSSIFDALTFALLLLVLNVSVAEFRTGWFVESLLTELVVVLLLRTRGSVKHSVAGRGLVVATALVALAALALPYLPFADALGFSPLPGTLMACVGLIVIGYALATELVKRWFHGRKVVRCEG